MALGINQVLPVPESTGSESGGLTCVAKAQENREQVTF